MKRGFVRLHEDCELGTPIAKSKTFTRRQREHNGIVFVQACHHAAITGSGPSLSCDFDCVITLIMRMFYGVSDMSFLITFKS